MKRRTRLDARLYWSLARTIWWLHRIVWKPLDGVTWDMFANRWQCQLPGQQEFAAALTVLAETFWVITNTRPSSAFSRNERRWPCNCSA